MNCIRLTVCLFVTLLLLTSPAWGEEPDSLDSSLAPYLEEYSLPALAAAVIKNGEMVAAGATGLRRVDDNIPVTIDDRFHLGSDTKAMTALLAAMLIESRNELQWDSTLEDIFPELSMYPALARTTVQQLMSHTSGLPGDNQEVMQLYFNAILQEGNLDEIRYWMLQQWSSKEDFHGKAGEFDYSNMGYTFLGAVLERVAERTWEELVTEKVFDALNLHSAGLGPQASRGRTDAAMPHILENKEPKAILGGHNADVPAFIGPAGAAHMSVLDFAAWAGWNAGQGKRGPELVQPGTLEKLHQRVVKMPDKEDPPPGTPPGGRYALGWGELDMDWAERALLYHGGSNGMNLAHIWIDLEQDLAMVTMTNISGEKADTALFALAEELYNMFRD